jgi:putative acetyltransferase
MGVHDDSQGRGVGTALMAAMVALADSWLGLRRLELYVYADNARAIHLYEKFGFSLEGTARCYAWRDGSFADACMMARIRE